jgi:CheY-like chemotaxis protein/two-component sensor histidine kinase
VRMVDDLLDISRITYGKFQLQREVVDVVELIRRAIESAETARAEQKLTITPKLPGEPLLVDGDPVRLEQVFSNLLGNAIKFTQAGGRIWISAEREPGSPTQATVRVRDNGAGIDHVLLPRVFDLFAQGDRAFARGRAGIGLGLTLAKRLVDLHGGTIEVHSAGNALGSEFVVRVPLASPATASRPRAATAGRKAGSDKPRRVLIVDDNEDSAVALEMLLRAQGHATKVTGNGASAVAAARSHKADTIVLDIGLPDMDGYEVAKALRATPAAKNAFIVAVTGFGRDSDRKRSRASGIDLHLTKPVDVDALLEEIAKRRDKKRG